MVQPAAMDESTAKKINMTPTQETQNESINSQTMQDTDPTLQFKSVKAQPLLKCDTRVKRICSIADNLLRHMEEVDRQILNFTDYVASEQSQEKPLYRWDKYASYRTLSQAIHAVNNAASQLEIVELPPGIVKMYRRRARHFSTSVSHSAASAMSIMARKSATCIDEIESSPLSAEAKDGAKAIITSEIKKVIKHCTDATGGIWAAYDLVEERLIDDESEQAITVSTFKTLVSQLRTTQSAQHTSSLHSLLTLLFAALTTAALTAGLLYLCTLPTPNNAVPTTAPPHAHILTLLARAQAHTNLSTSLHTAHLTSLEHRLATLLSASSAHESRIDNLVDSLGPPNALGLYFTPAPAAPSGPAAASSQCTAAGLPPDVQQHMQRLAAEHRARENAVRSEMQQLRKTMHRIDMRLTRRVDAVEKRPRT
ncbi:hypothetical protein ACN47E_000534 [Coniothyrium glycines]